MNPSPIDIPEGAMTDVMTTVPATDAVTEVIPTVPADPAMRAGPQRRLPGAQLRAVRRSLARWGWSSSAPLYAGMAVVAVGFALIGFAWAKIAGLLAVALQMPYLVSAGFTGLALVMVGLVIVAIAARRRDAADRTRQLERLTSILTELQRSLREDDEP
jgi:hypothetical protein